MTDATPLVAVVPTFQPGKEVLSLVGYLAENCTGIVVSDDASPCTSDPILEDLARQYPVSVVRHGRNQGIARGLNDGLKFAQSAGAIWLLTIDQDSVLPRNYAQRLLAAAHHRVDLGEPLGAIGAKVILDREGEMTYPHQGPSGKMTTEEVIQTGTLWSVQAMTDLGGFDESLGIDAVDAAACLALRQRGFNIGLADDLALEHRLGSSRSVRLGGRNIMITGHSPERRATMIRNRLRLFPAEFRQSPRHALRTIRRVAVNQSFGLITETDRAAKLGGTIRGIRSQRNG